MLSLRVSVSTHVRNIATAKQNYDIKRDLANLKKNIYKFHWPEKKKGQNGLHSMISSVSALKMSKGIQ